VRTVNSLSDLIGFASSAIAGDTILINTSVNCGTTLITFAQSNIRFTCAPGQTVSGSATEGVTITFSGDGVLLDNAAFSNTGTGSTPACVGFSSAVATDNYVDACSFVTNESALAVANVQNQVTNCSFTFTNTPDSHRFLFINRCNGETIIDSCTFAGNGATTPNTQCIIMNQASANYNNARIRISNCNNTSLNAVQRLMICESSLVGTNSEFYLMNNTFSTTSGFVIFFAGNALQGVSVLYLEDNTETFVGASPPGGKGLIGCDGTIASPGSNPGAPALYVVGTNTAAALRPDYTSWTAAAGLVAYATAIYPTPPVPTLPVLPIDVSEWSAFASVMPPAVRVFDTDVTSAGAASGKFLRIELNGVFYKIALLADV
jgi:hypothetical protein